MPNEISETIYFKRVWDCARLSLRAENCLRHHGIEYLGELVQKTESDLLRTHGFGRKSLKEVRNLLTTQNLRFGMPVENWPARLARWLSEKHPEQEAIQAPKAAVGGLPIRVLVEFTAAQRNVEAHVQKLAERVAAIDAARARLLSEREAICAALQASGRPLGEVLNARGST